MRRVVAVFVAVALSLTLAGCGGGDKKSEESSAETPKPSASAPPAAPSDSESAADRTPLEQVKFERVSEGAKSSESTGLPEAIQQRLDSGQPMLLLFFDKGQKTTDDVRGEVDAVVKQYRGTIDLLAYDIGQDTDDGKHDTEDAEAVTLARGLEVSFTPYIVLVDEQGLITWRYRGYVDRGIIEREVLRATD